MNNYQVLANSVIINKKNRLVSHDDSLKHIGTGRSAFVFKIKSCNKAIKVFFPEFIDIAKEEAEIYQMLQNIAYYPSIYDAGLNYIVIDYIEGSTLFECVSQGKFIQPTHIKEIDYALSLAIEQGLNPSDIHLRNLFISKNDEIIIIDVARFRQNKKCRQWHDLKKTYYRLYLKRFFPKKISTIYLNIVAFLYKKGLFPSYSWV
ncbi:protein kinase family protein [Sporosarcina sp. 6E9]|uniref:protein kinase family protein n=1 Tax=Sporosarcina sp. 6E9 TaxID=2819235 RepID=UPI001B303B66|nr:protein kinase family protein [Sporosarcina sp. 6E9]